MFEPRTLLALSVYYEFCFLTNKSIIIDLKLLKIE